MTNAEVSTMSMGRLTTVPTSPLLALSSALQSFCDPKRAASCSFGTNNDAKMCICLMGRRRILSSHQSSFAALEAAGGSFLFVAAP